MKNSDTNEHVTIDNISGKMLHTRPKKIDLKTIAKAIELQDIEKRIELLEANDSNAHRRIMSTDEV